MKEEKNAIEKAIHAYGRNRLDQRLIENRSFQQRRRARSYFSLV
ncbi:MAG: hypothetical protein V1493_05815 [Candidatus Diapherotrites archaeon]